MTAFNGICQKNLRTGGLVVYQLFLINLETPILFGEDCGTGLRVVS